MAKWLARWSEKVGGGGESLKQKVKKCGINENNENNKKATVEYIQ